MHWHIGPKAFYIEPWLIVGSVILWLAVLPLAGLVWSGTTLAKRIHLSAGWPLLSICGRPLINRRKQTFRAVARSARQVFSCWP